MGLMKGYKATINGKCRDQLYEVGHIYSCNHLKMCERGFHFCQKLGDVFKYYQTPEPFDEELIVYEVEALGEIKTEGVKSVTDRLKIVSVVDPQHYAHMVDTHKYDERGNLIKKILLNGNIYSYEYDKRGNLIKKIFPNGDIYSYEYDDRGNMTKEIHPSGDRPDGGIHSFEYDDRGNMIKNIWPDGYTYSYEYDDRGNLIREIFPGAFIRSFEYDERGNKTKTILPSGIYVYEYNEHGEMTKEIRPDGTVEEYETYHDFKVTVEFAS